ncbi:MAG: glycosyltransferase [Bdellovibrionia bacterium]
MNIQSSTSHHFAHSLPVRITKVLFLGYGWPEPRSSAAGLRTMNLVDAFLASGWEIIFCSSSKKNQYSENLSELGIRTEQVQFNDSSFDAFVSKESPDFVIFDRFLTEEQFGWRIQQFSPDSVRIIDTIDLHFLRREREKHLKAGMSLTDLAVCNFNLSTNDAYREIAAIYRSDCSLIISDFEIALLVERLKVPENLLFLSRFHYTEANPSPPFEERKNFAMIGNFRHAPNTDALHWLKNEIWPKIQRQLPFAQVHVYGAYPTKEIMNLTDSKTGFYVKGTAENQFETLRQYRINLAPLRFGAGIKGKITDGWWTGTPAISTSIGAEGMFEDLPWGGEISNDPHDFAMKAINLYQKKDAWEKCQTQGKAIIQRFYSNEPHSANLIKKLEAIRQNLAQTRGENFIGGMLNHHLHKSTKYFSLWIESKNSLKSPS